MTQQEVLKLIENGEVFNLLPEHFSGRCMTIEEMIAIFNHFGAFWQYEGEPTSEKPHALLKAGGHSNGFIVCKEVLQYPKLCTLFANEMFKNMSTQLAKEVDVISSSAYSAITLGYEVARKIAMLQNPKVEYIPVEKDEKGNPTIIRGGINPKKKVVVVNELMTTGSGSTWETRKAVSECNGEKEQPEIIGPAFVLVHRSKDYILTDGSSIFPIFHFDIENYKPEECPYCKVGSEAKKPKLGNNWDILHGRV